ncbi:MAG: hypothetical protein AAGM67_05410, partial [Bacteroidota bacterium]
RYLPKVPPNEIYNNSAKGAEVEKITRRKPEHARPKVPQTKSTQQQKNARIRYKRLHPTTNTTSNRKRRKRVLLQQKNKDSKKTIRSKDPTRFQESHSKKMIPRNRFEAKSQQKANRKQTKSQQKANRKPTESQQKAESKKTKPSIKQKRKTRTVQSASETGGAVRAGDIGPNRKMQVAEAKCKSQRRIESS